MLHINGRDTRAELRKISRCCFTTHSYYRAISTLRRMGWNPAMHLSIVKLSRFIRMMDRSPGRRNLAQFVTRTNFAEPARVAVVSFDGVNAHEKRMNCTAIEFHSGFLQRFHRRRSLPRDRKGGCLHSCDLGDYIVVTRRSVADGIVKITDCNAKSIATRCNEMPSLFNQNPIQSSI